ncbi:hypothetical protein BGW39_009609 [Mortierella sp. 14UC]|nr:hypothetical protein BGW39_009609 [Mortierella sp. 14UC]
MPQQSPSSSSAGPSNYRDPFNPPRGEGPRYEFTRINYRMIFEYASEIRDCLIKGKVGTTDRLLYNAEILSKIFMGCRVDQEPVDHVEEELALNPHQLRCTSCNIVKTPEWRKGPLGPRTLCNACGLIWGKLSRSKAALAKSKQESSAKAEPEKSGTDAQPGTGGETPKRPAADTITLSDIARKKRGRGRSTTRDADDMGVATRANETELIGSALQDHGCSSHLPNSKQSPVHSESSSHGQPGSQSGPHQHQQQQQMEDVTILGGDSPPPPKSTAQTLTAVKETDTVQEGGCRIDPLPAVAGPALPPQSPDTLPFSAHDNHDKEGPISGRKFTLSYLLA